jgi:hypothetical protein
MPCCRYEHLFVEEVPGLSKPDVARQGKIAIVTLAKVHTRCHRRPRRCDPNCDAKKYPRPDSTSLCPAHTRSAIDRPRHLFEAVRL